MGKRLHSPLPASLSGECKKAAAILDSFINPKLKIDGQIPRKIFQGAKGIAIYTAFRVGFLGSIRFGSGLIVARLPDGSWSAPSAMAMGGLGAGGQFGAELTDFVFVLTTDAAVNTFMQSGSLTLGGNISMAVGPIGRSAEAGGILGTKGGAGVFAYSKTRGLYGGLTVEGGVLAERADANKKLYGRKISARELLNGLVPSPPEAEVLMQVLNGDFFPFEGAQTETATPGDGGAASAEAPQTQESTVSGSEVPATEQVPRAVGSNTDDQPISEAPVSGPAHHEQDAGSSATTQLPQNAVSSSEVPVTEQVPRAAGLDTDDQPIPEAPVSKESSDPAHDGQDAVTGSEVPVTEQLPRAAGLDTDDQPISEAPVSKESSDPAHHGQDHEPSAASQLQQDVAPISPTPALVTTPGTDSVAPVHELANDNDMNTSEAPVIDRRS